MPDYLDSAEFIEHFLQKDARAISALFEKFYDSLFAFSKSITHNDVHSESIVVNCFLTLYQETSRFENKETKLKNLRYFIFLAVRNASLNYLNSKDNSIRCRTVAFSPAIDQQDESIEREIFKREVYERLYQGLARLPKERRIALELLYFEGRSYKQAAKIMGVTLEQFKTYRKKAFADIREFIPEQAYQYVFTAILLLFIANSAVMSIFGR